MNKRMIIPTVVISAWAILIISCQTPGREQERAPMPATSSLVPQPSPSATASAGAVAGADADPGRRPGPAITSSAVTGDGALWYGFDEFDSGGGSPPGSRLQGLYRLKDGRVSHFDIPAAIRVLEVGPDGRLYVGAGCGVLRFQDDWPETLLAVDCSAPGPVDGLFPLNISFGDDGRMWVGGATGLASYDGDSWKSYDISALRVALADDGSIWAIGWNGRAGSQCCLTHISGEGTVTYTWGAEIPAGPELWLSLFD